MSLCSDRFGHRPIDRAEPDATGLSARAGGFSLLEVLAALAILGMALSALYQSFGTALRASDHSANRLAAIHLAQSLLGQMIVGRAVQPVPSSGRQDRYRWVITVEPVEDEVQPSEPVQSPPQQQRPERSLPPPAAQWRLFRISVTVSWTQNRSVQLDIFHLARAS